MNTRESFVNAMDFKKPEDRLPAFEWQKWWEPTIKRWEKEGMPSGMDSEQIKEWFGLDPAKRFRFRSKHKGFPETDHGYGIIDNIEKYTSMKHLLFPKNIVRDNEKELMQMKRNQEEKGMLTWFGFDGFFWLPRDLMGIENHLYGFYDQSELIKKISGDLLENIVRILENAFKIIKPDFIMISEDMSYNGGPMLSKELFDEFIKPYYKELLPVIRKHGLFTFVDSDGDVFELLQWFEDVGLEGICPLERRAGVDVRQIRKSFPEIRMIGGFDKTIMHEGRESIIKEFERLLPVMRQGGFIAIVDHQTPPDVSLENYREYISLLKEYNRKAVI